jgi:hypothetical protein
MRMAPIRVLHVIHIIYLGRYLSHSYQSKYTRGIGRKEILLNIAHHSYNGSTLIWRPNSLKSFGVAPVEIIIDNRILEDGIGLSFYTATSYYLLFACDPGRTNLRE